MKNAAKNFDKKKTLDTKTRIYPNRKHRTRADYNAEINFENALHNNSDEDGNSSPVIKASHVWE